MKSLHLVSSALIGTIASVCSANAATVTVAQSLVNPSASSTEAAAAAVVPQTLPEAIAIPPEVALLPSTYPLPGQIAIRRSNEAQQQIFDNSPWYISDYYWNIHPNVYTPVVYDPNNGNPLSQPDYVATDGTQPLGPSEKFTVLRRVDGYFEFVDSKGNFVTAVNPDSWFDVAPNLVARKIATEQSFFTLQLSQLVGGPPSYGGYELVAQPGSEFEWLQEREGESLFAFGFLNQFFYPLGGEGQGVTFQHCGDLGSGYVYNINPYYPLNGDYPPFSPPFVANNGGGRTQGALAPWKSASGSTGALDNAPTTTGNFRLIKQADQSYAIQTSDGKHYVTATNGGGMEYQSTSNSDDNLVTNRTTVSGWEAFRIVDQGNCTYTIQVFDNNYIAYSPLKGRGFSTDASGNLSSMVDGYTAYFTFEPVY